MNSKYTFFICVLIYFYQVLNFVRNIDSAKSETFV